jgi:uncharacterized protein YrrD
MQFNLNDEQSEIEKKTEKDEENLETDLELEEEGSLEDIGVSFGEAPPVEERNLAGMIGHDLISLKDGVRIARIEDIMIDPDTLQLAAVVTSKGRLLNRKVEAVQAENIQVWGKDVLIVSHPDVVQTGDDLPDFQRYVSVLDQLRGREAVSMKGERIGQVEGVMVDPFGKLSALLLTKAVAGSKRLPIASVHSLGKDVLILDLSKIG